MGSVRSLPAALISVTLLVTACTPVASNSKAGTDALPPAVSPAFAGMLQLDPVEFRRQARERGFRIGDGGVVLDVQTEGLKNEHRSAFDRADLQVRSFRPEFERVSVVAATPDALAAVALLPFVRQVLPAREPVRGDAVNGN